MSSEIRPAGHRPRHGPDQQGGGGEPCSGAAGVGHRRRSTMRRFQVSTSRSPGTRRTPVAQSRVVARHGPGPSASRWRRAQPSPRRRERGTGSRRSGSSAGGRVSARSDARLAHPRGSARVRSRDRRAATPRGVRDEHQPPGTGHPQHLGDETPGAGHVLHDVARHDDVDDWRRRAGSVLATGCHRAVPARRVLGVHVDVEAT